VSYPGLPGSPFHDLAKRYMPRGTGAVFTFGVKGGYEMGIKVVESCELFSHLANIGDTRSLIIHPASTTHRQLDEEQLRKAGAGPEVIRLSIGLETAADIIADLDQALRAATGTTASAA
jgi:O-acetylhomoserine (thiol)-lyase